jgi:DNA mismatch repair protein MutL
MSIIQLLPEHIANQIAAGEVIQRPASVVKELMENSIDAGAQFVQLHVKDAGKTLIQVVDDGDGMTPEDAVKCFQRHATSKLKSADDLFRLQTKGFRGEALASIASIAHVSMRTKKTENDTGTLIEVEGNTIKTNEQIVCSKGTIFEVKNLFYNVPARRNFLKSESIEFGHIRDEFER